jgi:CHAD domain-containing protein
MPVGPEVKLARPHGTKPAAPGAEASAGDVVRHALALSVDRFCRHEPGVRAGEDSEAVHQARVATRRLRSDLRTFRPLVDAAWAGELRAELAWLAGLLGGTRDADVLSMRLGGRAGRLPEEAREAAGRLLAELEEEREAARARLLEAMQEERYRRLVERMVAAAREPALTGAAARPASKALRPLLARPWAALRKAVKALGDPPEDEELHQVRIRAKRCRYAAEATAAVLGRPVRRFAQAAAGLQEVLGEHQDAVVARLTLEQRSLDPDRAFASAAARLAELERTAAGEARAQWPAAWKALEKAGSHL